MQIDITIDIGMSSLVISIKDLCSFLKHWFRFKAVFSVTQLPKRLRTCATFFFLQMMYLNTTKLLNLQIKSNVSGHFQLGMIYYASVSQFYWFTSRTLALLERTSLHGDLPHPVCKHSTRFKMIKEHGS